MAQPIPTTLDVLVGLLSTRIAEVAGLDPTRVLVRAREDREEDYHHPAERYVAIEAGEEDFSLPDQAGRGRNTPLSTAKLSATVWTRMLLDRPDRDTQWETDAARGHLRLRHALYDALLTFQPIDDDDNWLAAEPVRLLRASRPRKGRTNKGWGSSRLDFELTYTPRVNTTYQ